MLSNANNHLFPFCLRFCCAHETENSLSTRGFIIFRSPMDFFQSPSGEGHLFSTALKEGFILMVAEKGMSGGEGISKSILLWIEYEWHIIFSRCNFLLLCRLWYGKWENHFKTHAVQSQLRVLSAPFSPSHRSPYTRRISHTCDLKQSSCRHSGVKHVFFSLYTKCLILVLLAAMCTCACFASVNQVCSQPYWSNNFRK